MRKPENLIMDIREMLEEEGVDKDKINDDTKAILLAQARYHQHMYHEYNNAYNLARDLAAPAPSAGLLAPSTDRIGKDE